MAMYRFTSWTNLVVRWCLVFLSLSLFAFVFIAFQISIEIAIPALSRNKIQLAAAGFAFSYLLLLACCIPGDADDILDGITTYIYGNAILRAGISWSDAKRLTGMFASNANETWYPMLEVKKLPKELRRGAIFAQAARVDRLAPSPTKEILGRQALVRIPVVFAAAVAYPFALSMLASYGDSQLVVNRLIDAGLPVAVMVFFLAALWVMAYKRVAE